MPQVIGRFMGHGHGHGHLNRIMQVDMHGRECCWLHGGPDWAAPRPRGGHAHASWWLAVLLVRRGRRHTAVGAVVWKGSVMAVVCQPDRGERPRCSQPASQPDRQRLVLVRLVRLLLLLPLLFFHLVHLLFFEHLVSFVPPAPGQRETERERSIVTYSPVRRRPHRNSAVLSARCPEQRGRAIHSASFIVLTGTARRK